MFRAMILATVLGLTGQAALGCAKPGNGAALESRMIGWINAQRAAHGLRSLKPSSGLHAAAQAHACDMAERGYFAHQRRGGPDFSRRLKSNGYRFSTAVENIAKTRAPDPDRAGQIWRESAGHWANILNRDVTEIGLAVAAGGGRTYWVMDAGRRF